MIFFYFKGYGNLNCPIGYFSLPFKSNVNPCFRVYTEEKSYKDAIDTCAAEQTTLASIHNADEDFILSRTYLILLV